MEKAPEPHKKNKLPAIAGLTAVISFFSHGIQQFGDDALRMAGSLFHQAPAVKIVSLADDIPKSGAILTAIDSSADYGRTAVQQILPTAVRLSNLGNQTQNSGPLAAEELKEGTDSLYRSRFLKVVKAEGLKAYMTGEYAALARPTAEAFSRKGQTKIASIIERARGLPSNEPVWKNLEAEAEAWIAGLQANSN